MNVQFRTKFHMTFPQVQDMILQKLLDGSAYTHKKFAAQFKNEHLKFFFNRLDTDQEFRSRFDPALLQQLSEGTINLDQRVTELGMSGYEKMLERSFELMSRTHPDWFNISPSAGASSHIVLNPKEIASVKLFLKNGGFEKQEDDRAKRKRKLNLVRAIILAVAALGLCVLAYTYL